MAKNAHVVGSWTGELGVAQLLDASPRSKDEEATLASWFIELSERERPASYLLSLVHLRSEPGMKAAKKKSADAHYELALFAIDPAQKATPDNPGSWRVLLPSRACIQLGGIPDDDEAKSVAEVAAIGLIDGWLPVDPASGSEWGRDLWEFVGRFRTEYQDGRIQIDGDGTINIITGL